MTGNVISNLEAPITLNESKINQTAELIINEVVDPNSEEIQVEYETSAPKAAEENLTEFDKRITISADLPYQNVLAFTTLNDVPKQAIKLYWVKDGVKELFNDVNYYDTNGNGLIDRIEWLVPHLSNQVFEVSITILNVQSYPMVGGNWTVAFTTTGQADLIISAVDGTTYAEYQNDNSSTPNDLDIFELKCGDDILFNKDNLINDKDVSLIDENNQKIKIKDTINTSIKIKSLYAKDFECGNETAYWTVKVLSSGKHHQQFNFSNLTAYAHNQAGPTINAGDVYASGNRMNFSTANGDFLGIEFQVILPSGVSLAVPINWTITSDNKIYQNISIGGISGAIALLLQNQKVNFSYIINFSRDISNELNSNWI